MAQSASGTFVGNGTSTISLPIGFEPDVVIVTVIGYDPTEAGWVGEWGMCICKNKFGMDARHNSSSGTTLNNTINYRYGGEFPSYGATDGYYQIYGSYDNGSFTISNSSKTVLTSFISGATYTWEAYAKA